ncbi:NAD(P)-binding protein [Parathielavia appendiculata]|uniref:NAD(P)-binding protein n=1 Tax=Parathielavia appendiculata TaxID=2587402 RepID=A0AAN6TQQ3_9PEZI|nr:NAD(P)-binding protein [Parathielavia appendiculata]
MHITVVPASPKTGQATIRSLLADPFNPTVRAYYRDLSKVPSELKSNPRFEAVKGDVEDAGSLDFSGSDAVLNITPPLYEEKDIIAHARLVSENVKAAVKKAESVKRLVLLSSVGAQYAHGTGEILTNHEAEVVLKDAAPEVVFVRCAYFMENWATALETLPQGFFFTTLTPLDHALPMIAVQDIGSTCAAELLATGTALPSSPHIFELHGPRAYTSADVQKAFEEMLGKSIEMRSVEKSGLHDFYAAVFPPGVAAHFAEMNKSYLEGGILYEDPQPTPGEKRYGNTELVDVFRQMLGAGESP